MASSASPSRPNARYALFGAVAGVLALGAVRRSDEPLARPRADDEVLTHVPARSDPSVHELSLLETQVASAPDDLARALQLAQGYIEASRREGDPRYLGAAEAALASWTEQTSPPAPVRLLHATILQSRHEFQAALVELGHVLGATPDDAQAWLTQATVQMVLGDYAAARESCDKLTPLVSASYAVACVAPIDAITGQGERARSSLLGALDHARTGEERAWLLSLLGEQSYWLGDAVGAERQLQQALALEPSDRYSRAVYADLLLDNRRFADAQKLLADFGSDDALALRSALLDLSTSQTPTALVRQVEQGFAESRLRGDSVHRREEARLWLARGDAPQALRCALESWAVQHEPWDARLVLESALAAQRPRDAAPVLAWLDETHFESPVLRTLADRLKASP